MALVCPNVSLTSYSVIQTAIGSLPPYYGNSSVILVTPFVARSLYIVELFGRSEKGEYPLKATSNDNDYADENGRQLGQALKSSRSTDSTQRRVFSN